MDTSIISLIPKLRSYSLLLSVTVMMLLVSACRPKEQVFVMKIASPAPAEEPGSVALQKFADLVNERSEGRINAKVYMSSGLGGNRDVIEGLQLGTVEVSMVPNSTLAVFVPSMNIFELPFLFRDNEHMFNVLDSSIGQGYATELEQHRLHLLGYFTFGVRHIMTNGRPINGISDLDGLKIRTMECSLHLDAFKAFGASPLPMGYGELFMALQTGMIDGAEAANSNYYTKRFYEVAPNWAQIGWLHLVAPVVMSKPFYDKLPKDLQLIVDESLHELVDFERQLYTDIDNGLLSELEKGGARITYPDKAPFIEASKSVYDKWANQVGGWERINEIVNFK